MKTRHVRDPVRVNIGQRGRRVATLGRLKRANQDTIRREEIVDSSSLSQELWVGENVEVASGLAVGLEDGAHRLGCPAWNGGLLDDNLGRRRDGGNTAGRQLDVAGNRGVSSQNRWKNGIPKSIGSLAAKSHRVRVKEIVRTGGQRRNQHQHRASSWAC